MTFAVSLSEASRVEVRRRCLKGGGWFTLATALCFSFHREIRESMRVRVGRRKEEVPEGKEQPKIIPRSRGEVPLRNKPCPCGSGMKYKYCCYKKQWEEHRQQIEQARNELDEKINGKEAGTEAGSGN